MKYFFLFPTPFCPMSRGHTFKKNLMYKNTARMWCCNTFCEKWVTLQVIPEQQKCFTDELCHCAWLQAGEKKHVATAGLCLSLYLATLEAKRGSMYFLGYCMLVDLFYQLFMKKCERDILSEIKKEHIMTSDSETLSRAFLPPCCCQCCMQSDGNLFISEWRESLELDTKAPS